MLWSVANRRELKPRLIDFSVPRIVVGSGHPAFPAALNPDIDVQDLVIQFSWIVAIASAASLRFLSRVVRALLLEKQPSAAALASLSPDRADGVDGFIPTARRRRRGSLHSTAPASPRPARSHQHEAGDDATDLSMSNCRRNVEVAAG